MKKQKQDKREAKSERNDTPFEIRERTFQFAARESRYWLRLIHAAIPDDAEPKALIRKCDELVRILSAIVATAKKRILDLEFGI